MANHIKQKRKAFRWLFILLVLVGLSPISVPCGAPTAACMPAPDAQGFVSVYYEVEPIVVALLETMLPVNLSLKYYSGYHRYQIIQPTSRPTPTEKTGQPPFPSTNRTWLTDKSHLDGPRI